MKTFNILLALLIFRMFVPACVCVGFPESIDETVKRQLSDASAVFQGKATEYLAQKGTDRLRLRFTIDRTWKGELLPEFEMETDSINSPNGPIGMNSCEYPFKKGMTYIVFAHKTANGWATGDRSGTLQVQQKEQDKEVLKALGPGKEPEKKVSFILTNNFVLDNFGRYAAFNIPDVSCSGNIIIAG